MYNLSLTVITGLSGAGKSVAAKVLEDMGYYTIDNMPLSIIEKLVPFFELGVNSSKVALVIDSRAGDYVGAYNVISQLQSKYDAKVLFLDSSTETLVMRYKANRRKHPSGDDLLDAIEQEREMLKNIRSISDIVIDTSSLSVHELSAQITEYFKDHMNDTIVVNLSSFGFKHGLPVDSDLVFDVRFIKNPYFVEDMRDRTGLEKDVQDYVFSDPAAEEFYDKLVDMIDFLIPLYMKEGKKFIKLSIGCTGGKHRSVALVERLAGHLKEKNTVKVKHRDINL